MSQLRIVGALMSFVVVGVSGGLLREASETRGSILRDSSCERSRRDEVENPATHEMAQVGFCGCALTALTPALLVR